MNTKKERSFFADNLKTLRHFKKMSTSEFARLIGVEPKRLTEVEKGRLLPTELEVDAVLKEFYPMTKEQLLLGRFEISLNKFSNLLGNKICPTTQKNCEHTFNCSTTCFLTQKQPLVLDVDLDKDREIMRLNGIIGKQRDSFNKLSDELKSNFEIAQNPFTKRGLKIAIKLFSKWILS